MYGTDEALESCMDSSLYSELTSTFYPPPRLKTIGATMFVTTRVGHHKMSWKEDYGRCCLLRGVLFLFEKSRALM